MLESSAANDEISIRPALKPWTFVLAFGFVSLFADMVYEGARSIIGPYLATLGASAALVSVVSGVGDFIGYGLRVGSAYLATRTRHYWAWTITGYAMTVLSVPLIGATGALVPAVLLYGGDRLGKAARSPTKDTLLSHASAATGRGKAFGVHQFMDQLGAVTGPLMVAFVLVLRANDYRLAFAILCVPGLVVLSLLVWLRWRVPEPEHYERPLPNDHAALATESVLAAPRGGSSRALPRRFWEYVAVVAVLSCGVASFPLLAVHAVTQHVVSPEVLPVLFALAMLVDGVAGLAVGYLYDRRGPMVLLGVPIAACGAALAFSSSPRLVWIGVAIWGAVSGILDSTLKAAVTTLVRADTRALAFGWLSLMRGVGLLVAGAALGAAYGHSVAFAVTLIVAANALALLGLARVLVFSRN